MAETAKNRSKPARSESKPKDSGERCPLFPDIPLESTGYLKVYRWMVDEDGQKTVKERIPGEYPPDWDEDDIADQKDMGAGCFYVELVSRSGKFTSAQGRDVNIAETHEMRRRAERLEQDGDDSDGAIEMVEIAPGVRHPVPSSLSAKEKIHYIAEAKRKLEEREGHEKLERFYQTMLTGPRAEAGETDRLRRELDDRRAEWQSEKRRLETALDDLRRDYERRLDRAEDDRKGEVAELRRGVDDLRRDYERRMDDDRRRSQEDLTRRDREIDDLRRQAREEIATRDRDIAQLRQDKLSLTEKVMEEKYQRKEAEKPFMEQVVGLVSGAAPAVIEALKTAPQARLAQGKPEVSTVTTNPQQQTKIPTETSVPVTTNPQQQTKIPTETSVPATTETSLPPVESKKSEPSVPVPAGFVIDTTPQEPMAFAPPTAIS